MAEPQMLLSVLHAIRQLGYNLHKIVRELARIKSLPKIKKQLSQLLQDYNRLEVAMV